MFALENSLKLAIGTGYMSADRTFLTDKYIFNIYIIFMNYKKLKLFCESKETTQNFAIRNNCSIQKIKYWLRKHGLQKRQANYLGTKDITHINDLYNSGKTVREVNDMTKFCMSTIITHLSNPRTKKEAYSTNEYRTKSKSGLNHYVFDEITKESAYALGLIITDGSVDKAGYRVSYHSKDDELIQIMRHIFNLNGSSYKSIPGEQLYFNSKYMVNSLTKYGVYPNKTFTVRMPCLEEKYYSHFFRGVIDGDGCIGLPRKTNIVVSIVSGSELFLKDMQEYLISKLYIKVYCRKNKRNISILEIHGENARKFCEFIYYDSEGLRLSRKFNNYEKHLGTRS